LLENDEVVSDLYARYKNKNAGRQPHFTTIANFVSSNCEAMGHVFHKVLLICDQSGLIGKEHFAIDGCKLPTDASQQWCGTHKELRKKSDKLNKLNA